MAEYWWDEDAGEVGHNGHLLEIRGTLVLRFVEQWGMVAGHVEREDSGKRAVLDLMPVEKVIERATSMAEGAVSALEERGWIKPTTKSAEQRAEHVGKLEKIKGDAQYDRPSQEIERIAALEKQLSEYRRKEREAARQAVRE